MLDEPHTQLQGTYTRGYQGGASLHELTDERQKLNIGPKSGGELS